MNKNKGLYMLFSDEESLKKILPGVYIKISNQLKSFNNSGMEVNLIYYNSSFFFKILNILPLELFVTNFKSEKFKEINFIYIRKPNINSLIIRLLTKIKMQNNCKVLMEVPTFPCDNEYKGTIISKIKLKKEVKYRKKLLGLVDKIVTFSDDKKIWGIETINVSNGINLNEINVVKVNTTQCINMIAVATHNFWHGYDRLIKGLSDFKKRSPLEIDQIKLHIVGGGPSIDEYKKLVELENLSDNVIFYGVLNGEALTEIFNICNLGIDALGRHRSNVFYNSTLKGKEYCARGLPVISGVETELDKFPEYKYYMRVPADESNIQINEIIAFFNRVYGENQEDVVKNIRKFAEEKFGMLHTMKPIIQYLNDR